MGIFDMLKSSALLDLIKDQRLKEIVTRREFRVSEEYFHRELAGRAQEEGVQDFSFRFMEGYGEISGKVKKHPIPFSIPFSARFTVHSVDFGPSGKTLYLKMEEVKPLDLEWVTRKVVENIPFLSYKDGIVACDLCKTPRLSELLDCRVNGLRPFDYIVVKDVTVKEGEIIGRLGFCL